MKLFKKDKENTNKNFMKAFEKIGLSSKERDLLEKADRAKIVYGLSNFALQKSADEIKAAWYEASMQTRCKKNR